MKTLEEVTFLIKLMFRRLDKFNRSICQGHIFGGGLYTGGVLTGFYRNRLGYYNLQ